MQKKKKSCVNNHTFAADERLREPDLQILRSGINLIGKFVKSHHLQNRRAGPQTPVTFSGPAIALQDRDTTSHHNSILGSAQIGPPFSSLIRDKNQNFHFFFENRNTIGLFTFNAISARADSQPFTEEHNNFHPT